MTTGNRRQHLGQMDFLRDIIGFPRSFSYHLARTFSIFPIELCEQGHGVKVLGQASSKSSSRSNLRNWVKERIWTRRRRSSVEEYEINLSVKTIFQFMVDEGMRARLELKIWSSESNSSDDDDDPGEQEQMILMLMTKRAMMRRRMRDSKNSKCFRQALTLSNNEIYFRPTTDELSCYSNGKWHHHRLGCGRQVELFLEFASSINGLLIICQKLYHNARWNLIFRLITTTYRARPKSCFDDHCSNNRFSTSNSFKNNSQS